MLKKLIIILIGFGFHNVSYAENLKLDTEHTKIGFKVKHLMIANVTGYFEKFTGTFEFNEKSGELKNIKVTMETKSINTGEADRDKHLKSKDFFDVEKFPVLEFSGKEVIYKDKKPAQVKGILKIKNISKSVTLDVIYNGSAIDPWKNKHVAFEATTKINRKDFGLDWNKALEAGGVLVGDEIRIIIEGEGTPP